VDISNARNETADPEQQVSIRSSLTLPWGLEFDAGLRWVDILHNNNGPEPGTVPYYLDLEARLAWHPTPRLELSLVGQNLLHDRHPEYGFPNAARVEAQRSVYGKLAWRY
jgi:iron complex outermembrane receptor protein